MDFHLFLIFKSNPNAWCGARPHDAEIQNHTLHQQNQLGAPTTDF